MGKIKVVEIIADTEPGGGPAHVLGLLRNLDTTKFEPFLICPEGYLATEAGKIKGVRVFNVEMRSKFDLVSAYQIREILQKIRALPVPFSNMVVHIHGVRAGFLARLVLVRSAFYIYTEHRWDADYHLKNPLNELLQKRILRRMNRRTNLIIAVSSSVKKFLLDSKLAVPAQLSVIPNAIQAVGSTEFRVSRNVKTPNRAPVIGTIGNLNSQKGQIYLIEAMKKILVKFPLATLEIIGEGAEREALEEKIESLGLKRHVSLLGRKEQASNFIKRWDVFVLPSVAETFGISILEAMRAGVPVVASRVGGIVDIIEPKKNGILVPSREAKALANAICEVINHPVLAAKLKRGGLVRVKDFEWDKVIKLIEQEYLKPFKLEENGKN